MTSTAGTPAADIEISPEQVSALVASQFPSFADLPVTPASVGWDNATFRLGQRYAVRLPRRDVAVELILKERRWLPTLNLPVATPVSLANGVAGKGYPWPWSIVPWLPGNTANRAELGETGIGRLAEFLNDLHQPPALDAPTNPVRGVPLIERAGSLEPRLARLGAHVSKAALELWADALAAPPSSRATWIHGDLHARNVLVAEGDLAGVIDWGDMARGDPATDLAAFWLWVPIGPARLQAMRRLDQDADTWRRARGWAFLLSLVLLDSGLVDHPEHARMGRTGLRLLENAPEIP